MTEGLTTRLLAARAAGDHAPDWLNGAIDLPTALDLQLAVLGEHLRAGETVGGWKVGLTSEASRTKLGADERPFGFVLASRVLGTGQALAAADQQAGRTSQPWDVAAVLPPTVKITKPAGTKAAVDAAKVEVEAVATPRGDDPVVAMRLLLDGRPYGGSAGRKGIVRERPEQKTFRQTWTLELTPGVSLCNTKRLNSLLPGNRTFK